MEIVLASTSPYRRKLMRRLGLPFQCVAPEVDESVESGEEPERRAIRLARLKAQSAASTRLSSPSLCIGSDQVVCLGDRLLRKPGTDERAAEQLAAASGNLFEVLDRRVRCLRFGGFVEPTGRLRSPDARTQLG